MSVKIFFADSNLPLAYIIRFFTWSSYSHVGLVDLDAGLVLDAKLSTGGVTTYGVDKLYAAYHTLVFVEPPCDGADLWGSALKQLGKPYDWGGIFGIVARRDWQDNDAWFCSEHVAWALSQHVDKLVDRKANRVTPEKLWDWLWQQDKQVIKQDGKLAADLSKFTG